MTIQCPACQQVLSTEGNAPRFCSSCGNSLQGLFLDRSTEQPDDLTGIDATVALSNRKPVRNISGMDITFAQDSGVPVGPQSADTLPDNSCVGPFRIVGRLGQGGMGTVYKAVHSETGQAVALKLLSRSVRTTDEMIQRFQRESQIAASINHPRSTFVYKAGQHQGQFYITMELMTGGTLTDVVRDEGPISASLAVDHVLDIISGLQSAHMAGIVHRDLKPSNCFLDDRCRVKIGDFGLAKSFLADSSLTQTGAFMGTPQYAAPEQLRSAEIDERTDIYAIGGTLFYLLTGRAPFVGNAAQVIASITSDPPPRVNSIEPSVPRGLARIINQTLEKDPARRPENLQALRQSLLPFSTRGATNADVGRRMAAFFIDISMIYLVISFVSELMALSASIFSFSDFNQFFLVYIFFVFIASTGYFSIQECCWGTSLGKWLLGMRVITEGNQKPSLMSSVVRASLLPGVSYVAGALPFYWMEINPFQLPDIWTFVWLQLSQLLSWSPCLLCFLTARKSNGFRGIHEVVSGTRVVRLAGALEFKRLKNVPVTTSIAMDSPESFGLFEAIGKLGRRPDSESTVLLGRDASLDRDVWIVKQADLQPKQTWENRKNLARPARLRVLEEKTEGDHRWIVTEAIKGMPLVDFVRLTPNVDWRSFRPLLREIAYELAEAQDDGTVPVRLSLESVWVDQAGRAKLLDQPLVPLANPASPSDSSDPGSDTAKEIRFGNDDPPGQKQWTQLAPFDLITGLFDEFIHRQVVPAHVLTFRRELDVLKMEPDPLRMVGKRLGELADQLSAWRWDDRLGVLAISTGTEFATALSLASTLSLTLAYVFEMGVEPMAGLMFGFGSLAAIVLGAVFAGGPIFQLTGVLVRRNKTLEPASRLRCAFRNWITWLPLILVMTCVAVVLETVISPELLANPQFELDVSGIDNPLMYGCLFACFPLLMLTLLGAIYSIIIPSRGLPDVIAGTRLIRK